MDEPLSTSRQKLTITLPPLHSSQQLVAESPARFKVLVAGRRWGKSRLSGVLSLATAAKRGRVWWVAPSYPQAATAWRELKTLAEPIPHRTVREDARRIALPGGGEITVKSADAPNSMLGEGLDLVVLDEAAYLDEDVWTRVLRPTLSDRRGKAVFISSPNGFNWLHALYQRGQDGAAGWASWRFPTIDNPLIAADEVEDARGQLPAGVFAQEYLAEFRDIAGAVFRHVEAAATATPQDRAEPGHTYVIGADWGRFADFTVFAVYDVTLGALVHLERFTGVDFPQQRVRLRGLAQRFNPSAIVAESNSIGLPQIEELQRDDLPIIPFTTTNATKAVLVDRAVLAFEQGSVAIIADPVLLAELRAFVGERLPSGLTRYAARGGHDDAVMAFLLALEAAGTADRARGADLIGFA